MWKQALRWANSWRPTPPSRPDGVWLGAGLGPTTGIVIQIPLGAGGRRVDRVDATMAGAWSLEGLRQVVGFATRRSLPVDTWYITGLWWVPARIERVARYIANLAEQAGAARVWIDTRAMPEHFRQRIGAHLRCVGCDVHEP